MSARPLVVDLDGTLIRTDLLHESTFRLLRDKPLTALQLPARLRGPKAAFKRFVASHTAPAVETLPYNTELLQWLREERAGGRHLVLCTASDRAYADKVASFLDLFDEVMASDGSTNLGGEQKALALRERFGQGKFDYIGNARADIPVWRSAAEAIVVSANEGLAREVAGFTPVSRVFRPAAPSAALWLRALRVQQWLKNMLLFAPALAAHRLLEMDTFLPLLFAFIAFSLTASATYLMNDLVDLESDRIHPRKRDRALAAGLIPVATALPVAAALLLAGLLLAALISGPFLLALACYLLLTCCYSWFLKRFILIDCFALALLYTLRIIAGAAAIDMGLSYWLLAFSAFLFLSLAFVKRYAELEVHLLEGREQVHGRGYLTGDAPLLQTLGVSAGYAAALVLSLYLNSEEVLLLYATPKIVWAAVLVLLYWISWMWIQAHRGNMHDDPLIFAIKDRVSLVAGVAFLLALLLGSITLPW